MDRNLSEMAHKAFPAEPDRTAVYPVAGQQRVLAALQQDIAAGRHLLCLTGPAGSGKTTLLRALRKNLKQGLVGMIEQPAPGRLLADVAKSLHVDAGDENESILRRRLVMLLAMVDQQKQPIIQIVDAADRLPIEELNLLLHFFPAGHATLILCSDQEPGAWLSGCSTTAGDARIDQCYRLDPWSPEETAGYIRHRLRNAALPDDMFPPATLAVFHQQSGGLPGPINQVCAAALENAPAAEPPVSPASELEQNVELEPEHGPEIDREVQPAQAEAAQVPSEIVTAPRSESDRTVLENAGAAPPTDRRRREATLRTVVPANEVNYEAERLSLRTRRLRRSVRLWRAATVLAAVAFVLVLTQDIWLSRLDPARFALDGGPEQGVEQSLAEGSLPESAAEPVDAGSSVPNTALPEPEDWSSDFAALHAPPFISEENEPPPLPGPRAATATPAPQPQSKASPEQEPPSVPESKPTHSAPRNEAEPKQADMPTMQPRTGRVESPRLTRAQRREVARLYAERAEYEWRNGEVNAAAVSIQRGLSSDPGNPRLLEMRAMLEELIQER